MHSVARENLQSFLHSYKLSSKEPGIRLIHNSSEDETHRKNVEYFAAQRALEHAKHKHVAFTVQAQRDYDGTVDEKSPLKDHTISFRTNDFIHVHVKFNADWWIGRIVNSNTEFGFVPTARRLANYMLTADDQPPPPPMSHHHDHHSDNPIGGSGSGTAGKTAAGSSQSQQEKSIWEPKCPYRVVPNTRPIVFIGPTLQHSRLTQLLHLALREEILKHFGGRIKYLKTDIGSGRMRGARWLRGLRDVDYDGRDENREVELIMRLTSRLNLVLVDSPNINTPDDVQHLPLAPIFFLIRVSDNKILCRLLRNCGTTRMAADIEIANILKTMNNDRVGGDAAVLDASGQEGGDGGDDEMISTTRRPKSLPRFEIVIEENGLKEATRRIINYLEKYINGLHYNPENI